jgi:hypothetical protein
VPRDQFPIKNLADGIAAWILGTSRFVEFFDARGMADAAGGRAGKASGRLGRQSRFGEFAAERQPGYTAAGLLFR